MKHKEFLSAHLSLICPAFLLSAGGIILFNSQLGMRINELFILIVLIACLVLAHLFDLYKKYTVVLITGIAFFVLACIGIFVTIYMSASSQDGIFIWWRDFDWSEEKYRFDYAFETICMVIFGAGIGTYFIQKLFVLRIICAAGIVAGFAWLSAHKFGAPFFALIFEAAYLITVMAEICYRTSKKRQKKIPSSLVAMFLLPVSLAAAVFTALLPAQEKPLNWEFVVRAIDDVGDFFNRLSVDFSYWSDPTGSEFNLKTMGYSDSGDLGGNLIYSHGTALTVQTDVIPFGSLYLAGSAQDTYTGRGWTRKVDGFLSSYNFAEDELDSLELIYAMQRAGLDDKLSSLAIERNLTVAYRDIYTRSAFLPLKTCNTQLEVKANDDSSFEKTVPPFKIYPSGVIFDQPQGNGLEYDVDYIELNAASSEYDNFVRAESGYRYDQSVRIDPDELNAVVEAGKYDGIVGIYSNTDSILRARADWIEGNYISLPSTLPERVKILAQDLTKDYDNAYDKLKAIEKYLNTSFTYTLSPGDVPEGRDVVDYFLFDSKQGYCTYYATAMAVMARSIGIPTRYVQGFATRLENKIGDNEYSIGKNSAHAWVEAYLEGVGWVPFEPTPNKYSGRYTEWPEQFVSSPNESGQYTTPNASDLTPNSGVSGSTNAEVDKASITLFYFLVAFAAVIAAAVIFSAAYCIAVFSRYRKRYRAAGNDSRIYMDFRRILLLLGHSGFELKPGETLSTYVQRIKNSFAVKDVLFHDLFYDSADIYTRLHYRGESMTESEMQTVQHTRALLDRYVKSRLGGVRYLIFRLKIERTEKE